MPEGSWNRRRVLVTVARLLPTRRGDLLVGQAEVLDQLLVGRRLVERVEVLPLQVLDQRLLGDAPIVGPADDGRDRARDRRGGPPASGARRRSAGTAVVRGLAHEDRLEDPELSDRRGQLAQRLLVELLRGWFGLGSIAVTGSSRSARRSPSVVAVGGDEGARPLPRPLRRAPPLTSLASSE